MNLSSKALAFATTGLVVATALSPKAKEDFKENLLVADTIGLLGIGSAVIANVNLSRLKKREKV